MSGEPARCRALCLRQSAHCLLPSLEPSPPIDVRLGPSRPICGPGGRLLRTRSSYLDPPDPRQRPRGSGASIHPGAISTSPRRRCFQSTHRRRPSRPARVRAGASPPCVCRTDRRERDRARSARRRTCARARQPRSRRTSDPRRSHRLRSTEHDACGAVGENSKCRLKGARASRRGPPSRRRQCRSETPHLVRCRHRRPVAPLTNMVLSAWLIVCFTR